ncbi:hypothetical protein V5735_10620 (plasmid) [Haladaptatus sp. SPP-AMP-3]|uniref:hypothetical protein n=1 Tax=Haladaptatus sp. SPP-AMP-3 TaxID=3121295 RepID=UPI003C2C5855
MPTYDIVEEGADNTGDTAIDSVLDDLVGSDTTIVFPSGTYRLNELVVPSGMDNLELVAPNGARLVPGRSGDDVRWLEVSSRGFVLDGFELDMRNTEVPPFVRMNSNSGNWELKRLVTRGKVRAATDTNVGSNDSSDARTYFRLSADAGTRGLIQDCYFHEGACEPDEASNRRAVLVESGSGKLLFNRCWFEQWAENTIYAKKPAGAVKVYNCFFRNTQNGMRLGGNSEVNNTVSIKDAQHARQAWSNGSLQRGVNSEATVPTDLSEGIDSYNGTLIVVNSDFYHRYPSSSCGGAITAPHPCQNIIISRVRISYDSTKNHDAIYTHEGQMNDGSPVNLESLRLQNVHVRNDHDSEYAVFIGEEPDTWGTVSGVLGGTAAATNSSYVRNRMTIDGDPDPPVTEPALPSPPPLGEVPMQSAKVVRIDNTGNSSESTFEIEGGDLVLPSGDDGATVNMGWARPLSARRVPNSTQAKGTIPPGEVYAFYVTGGIESTQGSGPATWTVDGEPFTPGTTLATKSFTADQPEEDAWRRAGTGVPETRVVVMKPLSYNGGEPCHTRLRNVEDGSFQYKLEEWEYLGGTHTTETAHMLAVQPTEREVPLGDGSTYSVTAGTVTVDDSFSTVSLGDFFDAQPVVLTKSQTFNGSNPIVTRVREVSQGSFDVRVQEESGLNGHVTETVGYIALEQATGRLDGEPFEVGRTGMNVTDEWYRVDFQQQYDSPRFIADMQTFHGLDTAELRYRNLTGTGVEVKVEEEQSGDEETGHATETIGYAVFEGAN